MALRIGIIPTETPVLHEKLNIYVSGKHGAIIKTATMENRLCKLGSQHIFQ